MAVVSSDGLTLTHVQFVTCREPVRVSRLGPQYPVGYDHRDQRGDEGYEHGDGHADHPVSVFPVPQIHASAPRVQAYGAICAREGDGRVEHSIAAPRIGNEAPVLQVAKRQIELRGDQLGANLLRKLGRIEALKLAVLVPGLALAQGMNRQPTQLFAGYLHILVDVLAVVVQAVQDTVFVVPAHGRWCRIIESGNMRVTGSGGDIASILHLTR